MVSGQPRCGSQGRRLGRHPQIPPLGWSWYLKDYKVRLPSGRTRPAARAGTAEGKGAPHPGRGRPSLWLPGPLRPGKTKRRCNRIRAFVEYQKAGTAINAGPAPYRAAGSLSSVDGESIDTPIRGKPSVAGTWRVLPTHSNICLQRPALPVAGLN